MQDIIIVGAGAVGAFIARSLSRYEAKILLIDKETDVGDETSMANSAIAHSGYDPEPGTKKAYFNVEGNKMMKKVCSELDVSYGEIGTMTIALDEDQLKMLSDLKKRAEENGVEAKLLSKEETLKLEPNVNPSTLGSLLCPKGGIVNPFTLSVHAAENAVDNGVELHLAEEVTKIEPKGEGFLVTTSKGSYDAKIVINAAGVYSDKIAAMVDKIDWKILPRKGEYYVLDHYAPGLVNHVLFPLPSAKGKGVLVSLTTSGNYIVGPSSELVDSCDDCSTDPLTLSNVKKMAQELVPSIPFNEGIRVYAGVRATPSTHDFIIEKSKTHPRFINVAGIESPGLVSSPAIGEYVADELVAPALSLRKKASYNPIVKPYTKPSSLPLSERNELIKANPDFGEMVCMCEKVSKGEILECLSRSVQPHSVKAVKKRTRAGFGKCQGGFCQPRVVELLAEYYGISPTEVLYDKPGSEIVRYEVKKEDK